jgi:aldose sugar dehydrogenase
MRIKFFRSTQIFALSLLLIIFPSCQNSGKSIDAVGNSAANNYVQYCAGCHGFKLEKFEKKNWMFGDSNNEIIESIANGRYDIGMPAFKKTFTDEEIIALAEYVKKGVPEDLSDTPAKKETEIHQSQKLSFVVDTVVSGLNVPWGLEFLPNGDLLIAERSGILYLFSNNKLTQIEGLPPVYARGQGGLLDLQLHPNYKENRWIYISFSEPGTVNGRQVGNTSIIRTRLEGNKLVDTEKLFTGEPKSDRAVHFGCKLEFDKQGYLYFGLGDRGQHFDFPQKLDNHNGKIHRIHDDGRIPADNPFVDTPGALPSIYSYGHRNPQGTAMHPVTGQIWVTEHGPRGGDELNLIKPAVNYGWPAISYGINYDGTVLTELTEKEGMEQPIIYWDPSIAPCGMIFVTGDRYPAWKNNIMIGSLRFQYLERVVLSGERVIFQEKLIEGIGRVRNVKMSPDGYIYVAIETPGKIVRLVPVE